MAATGPVRTALRDAFAVDRATLPVNAALRNTVGVVLPLAVGAVTGHVAGAVAVAVGAQNVALADRPGPYRLRLARLALTGGAAAVAAALGLLVGSHDALAVPVTLLWAFGAGLLVALGPTATQVGVTSTILLLIVAGRAQLAGPGGGEAALFAGLQVLAGAALQTLFAVSAWPLRRFRPERRVLANAFRELADAADERPGTDTAPSLTSSLDATHRTLRGLGRDRSVAMDAFRVLLDEAERIRIELLALTGHAERLAGLGANAARERVADVLDAAYEVLRAVAATLEDETPDEPVTLAARQLAAATGSLRTLAEQAGTGRFQEYVALRAAAARASALEGQLRTAVGTASTWRYEEGDRERPPRAELPSTLRPDQPWQTLLANLTPGSAAFRHAVRLAGCLGASDLLVRLLDVPRGYWLPVAVLITLQPDFAGTLKRGLLRSGGTMAGLLLATGLVVALPNAVALDIALVALLFFGFRLFMPTSVGFGSVFLTALVVVLLAMIGVDAGDTILERGVYTVLGVAVALGSYLAWPTWERGRVRPRLADLLDAYRGYLDAVADPAIPPSTRTAARSAARVARSNAEDSVERLRGDPRRAANADLLDVCDDVLTRSHQFVHAAMAWEGARQDADRTPASPATTAFAGRAGETLGTLADAVRTGVAPAVVPDLPACATAVREQLAAAERPGPTDAAVIEATARAADALTALTDVLRADAERRSQP